MCVGVLASLQQKEAYSSSSDYVRLAGEVIAVGGALLSISLEVSLRRLSFALYGVWQFTM